jgi:hypothetical protein
MLLNVDYQVIQASLEAQALLIMCFCWSICYNARSMPSRNIPQTRDDLRQFRKVEVSIITHLHAVADGRLLQTVEQIFPIPLDKKLRTLLNWAVKDFGISYTTAMESSLAEWLKALAADKAVHQDMRKAYPHLPEFHISFSIGKHLTWILSTD